MIHEVLNISLEGISDATLTTYLLSTYEDVYMEPAPLVIICPGGGYEFLSNREAEQFALQWNARGIHAAVLRYAIAPERFPAALMQLATAVALVKEKSKEWCVNPQQIFIEGSSAGGHLTASYGVFWKKPYLLEALGIDETDAENLRPAGLILNYPVISSGEFAHEGSFRNLMGDAADDAARREELSIEKQVNEHMPPVFVWHGGEDDMVPPENSLLLAMACRKAGVPVELHLYMKGVHGLGLSNELTMSTDGLGIEPACESWMELAYIWLMEVIG
ncbi:MAG: alpha/beta hydrolase [Eubacterium sp.]|nr:alpha/beta hydrolase [Eubacterium sp.]